MAGSVTISLLQQMQVQTPDMLCWCRVAPDMEALRTAIRRAMVACAIIKETGVAEATEAAGTEVAAAMEAVGGRGGPSGRAGEPGGSASAWADAIADMDRDR